MANLIKGTGYAFGPLPELFKALEARNHTPYTVVGVLHLWESLILDLHEEHDGFQHQPLSDAAARNMWTLLKHSSCSPLSVEYRDPESHRVISVLSRQNDLAIVREAESILGNIYNHRDPALRHPGATYPGDGTMSNKDFNPNIAKFFLLSCLASYASGLSSMTFRWLSMIWEAQPSSLRPIEPPYDGSVASILRDFGSTASDANNLHHFLTLISRLAMAIADIWTASETYGEYDSTTHLPGYKWYLVGLMQTTSLLHREIEDPFSTHPRDVRELLPNIDWLTTYDKIWKIAQEARAGGVGIPGRISLRQGLHNTLVEMFRTNLGLGSSSTDSQTGAHVGREMVFRSSMWAAAEQDPILDWGIIDRVHDPVAIYNDIGTTFYGDQFENTVDGPFHLQVDVDDDTASLDEVNLEAYGPRHQLVNVTLPKPIDIEGTCSICQEDFTVLSSASMRGVVVKSCLHLFHAECIDDWVNGTAANSHLCPVCRQQMVPTRRSVRPIN